ncbi:hypothetical protein KIH31_13370 [Paenarthrobacter sp. DKR-5]|uniref:hypothetical protein n=1 Tax=Paenarthrobacter sp. DKR-5 TaxID=2835535 RepID=UPI001BDD9A1A|nr:hypothetical protein [Paenarthrobacter sp. DKR-5]MBT1003593.1 hypothetical protein [Paenarthrobacter sp. DKR-5]
MSELKCKLCGHPFVMHRIVEMEYGEKSAQDDVPHHCSNPACENSDPERVTDASYTE